MVKSAIVLVRDQTQLRGENIFKLCFGDLFQVLVGLQRAQSAVPACKRLSRRQSYSLQQMLKSPRSTCRIHWSSTAFKPAWPKKKKKEVIPKMLHLWKCKCEMREQLSHFTNKQNVCQNCLFFCIFVWKLLNTKESCWEVRTQTNQPCLSFDIL